MQLTRRSAFRLARGAMATGYLTGAVPAWAQAKRNQLKIALEELPKQLDPLRYLTNPGYRIMSNIYDTLIDVDYKNGGKIRPGLATAWQRVDDKTLELTLREGVLFHDGSPMTSRDVVFSFSDERMLSRESPGFAVAQQLLSTIASVEAVDERRIRVTTKSPDPVLEQRLSAWGGQIISEAAFRAAGGWTGFAQKPIGTGAFSVVSLTPEDVRLAAFRQHWRGAPHIDTLIYRSAPELSARIVGLAAADFDLIADVPPDQFAAVTRSPELEIVGGPIASLRVIKFDTRNPILKDPRVRQALGLAVDRKAIVDALWQGRVNVPNGHQLEAYGDLYDPSRPVPKYDPARARQLLSAAGYKGEVIPYRIRTNAYGPEVATAQILVAMWNAVGVKVDLQIKENFGRMLQYPGVGMRNGVDPVLVNDPLFALWRSYNETQKEVWSNDEFFKLGHVLESNLDRSERKKAFSRMLDIFEQDPPSIILHTMGLFYGKRKSLNWSPYPHVYMDFGKDNARFAE